MHRIATRVDGFMSNHLAASRTFSSGKIALLSTLEWRCNWKINVWATAKQNNVSNKSVSCVNWYAKQCLGPFQVKDALLAIPGEDTLILDQPLIINERVCSVKGNCFIFIAPYFQRVGFFVLFSNSVP